MKTINYSEYLDKVKGCFLGKTVIGTLGAPYEGVKMPMELAFRPEMVDTMLPNDDLDLQVLWLEVLEKKGLNFTSDDLLKAFCENCDYSPGEYAIMRKNYEKRIMPPVSGIFCNDFYIGGMGCPIRSEIWACLAPGEPDLAADLSTKDGILDHSGRSVHAERFFAACEARAFFENDMKTLFTESLSVVPEDSPFREMVIYVLALCEKYSNIKDVLSEINFRYGHLDCTNMLQNMGVTLAALLFGEYDMIKTGMLALNCGFDTDCTCASAGALLGIMLGEKKIREIYGWSDIRFVLGVRADRRSDRVDDLAEDTAILAAAISKAFPTGLVFENAPEHDYGFEAVPELTFSVKYRDNDPSFGLEKDAAVTLFLENNGSRTLKLDLSLELPENTEIKAKDAVTGAACGDFTENGLLKSGTICLEPGIVFSASVTVGVKDTAAAVWDKNIIQVKVTGDAENTFEFGVSGDKIWRMTGPIWSTTPPTNEEILSKGTGYWHIFPPAASEAESTDNVRTFHLNFARDSHTDIFEPDELFEPIPEGTTLARGGKGVIARPYKVTNVEFPVDAFELNDLFGLQGPCVVYLSQILVAPEDMTVFAQLGYSCPFKFFVNGELIGERHDAATWDAENAHFQNIHLKKGENKVVLRLTRVNRDSKYSLIFSTGLSCSTHWTCLGTKKI